MLIEEALNLFIMSRKHGTSGAKKKARPRTIDAYRDDLEPFVTFLIERGIVTYEALKKSDLMAFLEKVDATPTWGEATKLKVLRSLRAFFLWVDKDEDCR